MSVTTMVLGGRAQHDGALNVHLPHRAARADEPRLAAALQFLPAVGSIRLGSLRGVTRPDEQVLLVMHPAHVHGNAARQGLVRDQVEDATLAQGGHDLAEIIGGGCAVEENIVEALPARLFLTQRRPVGHLKIADGDGLYRRGLMPRPRQDAEVCAHVRVGLDHQQTPAVQQSVAVVRVLVGRYDARPRLDQGRLDVARVVLEGQ